MSYTRFSSVVLSAGVPVLGSGSGIPTTTGKVFFVDSNGTPSDGTQPDRPFLTLAGAMAMCRANKGDVIVLMPGHAETLTASPTFVAGVYVVALGWGDQRATITGNAAADIFNLSVASVVIDNVIFAAPETDNQTAAINIDASGCSVTRCKFVGSKTSKNITDVVTVTANAHYARIQGNEFENVTVDVATFISVEGAARRVRILDNVMMGNCSTACLLVAAVATLMEVGRNVFVNNKASTIAVSFTSNATGFAYENYSGGLSTTLANNAAWGTAMRVFENYTTEEAGGASGILIPAADTD